MQRTGISRILSQNDVQGERLIAVFQAFMAMIIFTLHMVSASKNNWESLSGITLSFITGILCASLLRIALTKDENHPTTFLHGLTLIDGALLFCLIYSYNLAYALPFAVVPLSILLLGEQRGKPLLEKMSAGMEWAADTVMPWLIFALGLYLIWDSINYFYFT